MKWPTSRPLIVSYYTEGTPYEKEAHELIKSCQALGLEHAIVPTPNFGSWSKNCCFKPIFLLGCLEKFNRPLVWTDVDSTVVKTPTFFDTCTADIAVKIFHDAPKDSKSRILTSTFFINNTPKAKELLRLWHSLCDEGLKKDPLLFDQACLNIALQQFPLDMVELPSGYLTIIDHPDRAPPEETVFLHTQASRIYQKVIDQELSQNLTDWFSAEELKKARTD